MAKDRLEYRKAVAGDADAVCGLVQRTITAVYPKYYPAEVVDFFCRLHCKENILRDICQAEVWLVLAGGQLIGTGSFAGDHITRIYVDPRFQRQGFGSALLQRLEDAIAPLHDTVFLDASLPAARLYESRGYTTLKHEAFPAENGAVLVYEVMQKRLARPHAPIGYDGKFFVPKANTANGEVGGGTVFAYHQAGSVLWADYSGGGIVRGHLVGTVAENGELDFYYQHVNGQNQVRIGKCHSVPRRLPSGKLELCEHWQWLNGDCSKGASILAER